MLRKDSSFREISVADSLEHKSFLSFTRKPSTTKMLDQNKENTARTYSDTAKEFFFKKEAAKYQERFQSPKSYLETRLEGLEQRKKTQTPTIASFTPLQNKQASQERQNQAQRKQSVNTSVNLKLNSTNQTNINNEFNIYKQSSIPTSYLDAAITQRTQQSQQSQQKVNTSPERPTMVLKQYYITSLIKAFKMKGPNSAKEHLIQCMQGSIISKKLKVPAVKRNIQLPHTDKKTIIFDLDETLVHCNTHSYTPGDVLLNIAFENGEKMDASINIRPYTQHILQTLSRYFEIIVFTASQSNYANAVIDYLDPGRKIIQHRFYREHCISMDGGHFVKDLRILSNRKLENILIVDNAPHSYLYQLENGVPILPYIDNKSDEELKSLLTYLIQFRNAKDVRELNSQLLKQHRFSEYDDPMDLLKTEFYEYQ